MEIENNRDSDWETEEEDFIKLKIENISQIKKKFNTFGKTKLMKVKKMDKENYKRINKCNEYLNESIYPNIRLLQPPKFKSNLNNKNKIDNNNNENDLNSELDSQSKIFHKIYILNR